jgi:hypothetical protein
MIENNDKLMIAIEQNILWISCVPGYVIICEWMTAPLRILKDSKLIEG